MARCSPARSARLAARRNRAAAPSDAPCPPPLPAPSRSRALEAAFALARRHGEKLIYGVNGLTSWKRKWRAEEQAVTYCAVRSALPWREALAAASLILSP